MERTKQIEQVCHDLERLWKQYPEQRLGQLLENYIFPPCLYIVNTTAGGQAKGKTAILFWQEDDETDKRIIMNTDFKHSPVNSEVVNNGEKTQ